MTVAFYTLGCKVNIYETEAIMGLFKERGYKIVPFDEEADVYVINTCSVTNTSDSKSRKIIRSACKNKNSIVVVMGCYSQAKKEEVSNIEGVSIVIGTKDKRKVIDLVDEYKKDKKQIVKVEDVNKIPFENMMLDHFENHTRAFVKVQDGCNNYCSYCIIPYTRGNVRSKDINLVIEEVKKLCNNGYKEVVLTGIHTGHYGEDKEYDLTDLIRELSKIDNLYRIRISSIEITEITDKFLEELKTNKKIVDHMHIPLQSGTDKILKLMNRKYDMKYYFDKINKIRNIRPDIAITTDVIVGFPNETDEDFNDVVSNIIKIGFTELHVFPYSRRKGTRADLMDNQIDGNIKKQRVRMLLNISEEEKEKYYEKYLDSDDIVLTEKYMDGYLVGHLSNYGKVKFKGNENY